MCRLQTDAHESWDFLVGRLQCIHVSSTQTSVYEHMPWGTPESKGSLLKTLFSIKTYCDMLCRKYLIHVAAYGLTPVYSVSVCERVCGDQLFEALLWHQKRGQRVSHLGILTFLKPRSYDLHLVKVWCFNHLYHIFYNVPCHIDLLFTTHNSRSSLWTIVNSGLCIAIRLVQWSCDQNNTPQQNGWQIDLCWSFSFNIFAIGHWWCVW